MTSSTHSVIWNFEVLMVTALGCMITEPAEMEDKKHSSSNEEEGTEDTSY